MNQIRLRILLPSKVLADCAAVKVVAEAPNGFFGILPRHIDFVAPLVPGVLAYIDAEGREHFVGTGDGILVKRGEEVTVSTMEAIESEDLESLREKLYRRRRDMGEHERSARSALARLEAGVVKRFMEFAQS